MRVLIPSALHDYTHAPWVEAQGETLGALLDDLDRQFPGLRFRMVDEQGHIRRHMRCFIGGVQIFALSHPLATADEVLIVQALSGG
ncbi:MoaD/ThiS family protein [Denitromonas iodatirespirans]|uniref:MoaD/ThiS family protein n=1 Tax=Denitromonas iodatirespirans TaxID=2795389 RepID=A0A944H9N2_DENI1|nr:MoaD/ThiS family protein [Denitromonas iodatirespirans]MBT0963608.1 MoaD/ThiS family protein [Denitromonas iodatirespirans]